MPFYCFRHPDTDEVFEDHRAISKRNEPYIADDGVECPRDISAETCSGWKGDKEVWEACPDEVKLHRPKYLKTKDGRRVKYDPTKHR